MDEPRPNRSSPSARASERPAADSTRRSFWRTRLGLDALRYPIPIEAATIRYSLGAFTAFSFGLLVITGVWLAQFYNPTPAGAHDSVLYIITRAPFGDIARSLHYWSASAMVVSIVAHIVWVFYSRAYRAPREITWYAGVLLSGFVFLMVVTGTVLRYDQEGYEALAHLLAGGEMTGALGRFFTAGFTLSAPVLARVFSLHTSVLPIGILVLIGLHLWLVRTLGMSVGDGRTELFSNHLPRVSGICLILLAALLALAVLRPEGVGYAPVPGYEITKPFWAVLWIYALESTFGMWALVWAPAVLVGFLIVVPIVDRSSAPRSIVTMMRAAGLALFLATIGLGIWAALAPPQQHLGM